MDYSCEEEFVCGNPKVDVRVGDEYQAEIPPMMSDSKRAAFLVNPLVSDLGSSSFAVGLPLHVTWIDAKKCKDTQGLGDDDNVDMSESLKSLKNKRSRRGEAGTKKQRMYLEAAPEEPSSCWEDSEVDGFVLGLYTFGKNFTQVKKLLESKETGDLSFYYGKFYKSAKHKIWSNSLKKQSRKCIQGKKLYSGWRLQQLLSRLIPNITDESQRKKLVNVSKSFAEGNRSLERYIIEVKELVGLQSLVEAVAIGKDKDLTVLTTEPMRSKQWFAVSSAGSGAYTSLTSEEIIEKLDGGGSRLSKARCIDIFWDAVWPRLLARGWHSEQAKDIKSKDNIVFLIPGVEKFSRRNLVKQNHYFDSISEILKKVVAEPELLEFETTDIIRPPNGFIEENSYEYCKQEKCCYLRSPDTSSTHLKFAVVDTTSLASGGKLCRFRELKNPSVERSQMMPLDAKFAGECKWEKKGMKKLVEEPGRFMIVDTSGQSSRMKRWRHLPGNENLCKAFGDSSSQIQSGTNTGVTCELSGSGVKEASLDNVRSKKRSVRKSESVSHHSVSSFPSPKRRRLSTCVRKDMERFGQNPKLSEETKTKANGLRSKKQEALQEVGSLEKQQEDSNWLCSDKKCSSEYLEASQHREKTIKLPSMPGSDKRNSPSTDHGTTQKLALMKQEEEELNQQTNTDLPRRQSTRKRPLTTRALEALESGFYTSESLKSTSHLNR
ncbi:unnamed protein product [Eruca vesicaria subsp. sativa]|uniref:SANT domain-containing protein n=1 Tax=Eruca vesicaria subsp. sativa TaxID=29727 RepID=A0ABC8JQV9_ERUVS|nr:unnamed protein product [Eruca vesicaria subsp. sativa]